jgi:hypothetical protein
MGAARSFINICGGRPVMRLVLVLLSVVALAFAAPAAADRPTSEPIFEVFPDVNPCTGTPMVVTFVGTVFFHEHGSRIVAHAHRTITTSDGFVGHGTDNFVDNGQVVVSRLSDIMSNASGDRFRAHFVFVANLRTETVRVERGGLTCIGK